MKKIMFYKRVKELREARDWNQEELAEKCSVKQACVSKWEKGITLPTVGVLVQLSEIFEVSTDYLLGLDEHNIKIEF